MGSSIWLSLVPASVKEILSMKCERMELCHKPMDKHQAKSPDNQKKKKIMNDSRKIWNLRDSKLDDQHGAEKRGEA